MGYHVESHFSPGAKVDGDTGMSSPTRFLQTCPTCGRRLEVRVEHLGRELTCQHCRGRFVATHEDYTSAEGTTALLRRADELLQMAAQKQPTHHPI